MRLLSAKELPAEINLHNLNDGVLSFSSDYMTLFWYDIYEFKNDISYIGLF